MFGDGRCFAYHGVLATHKILIPAPLADNLPASEPAFFALPDHAPIGLQGPDAAAFAQAQFANDVSCLGDGQWQWNAWLTPKGRVIALFALLRRAEDDFLLLAPDHPADELASQLARFVFRRKLKVAARTDLHASGSFAPAAAARGAQAGIDGETVELDFGAEDGARTLRIGAAPADDDPGRLARWFTFDLIHGLPHLPASQREQWTPQQLSLERLRAFSVKKGCYPGQEIVARTHFLGKAKRGLALLRAPSPLAIDADVGLDGAAIGKIVSVAPMEPHCALAVLPMERAPGALQVGEQAVEVQPLLEGLAR